MKLINWLQSKTTRDIPENKDDRAETMDRSNMVVFGIDGNNSPWVSIELNNPGKIQAENFAQLLVQINNGLYNKTIVELLVDLSKQHPELADMIETLLIAWGSNLSKETKAPYQNNDNKPIIRPRYAFSDSHTK